MKISRLIASVMMLLLVGIPAAAQDGYPLPENLPPITPENAAQVTELARVGGVVNDSQRVLDLVRDLRRQTSGRAQLFLANGKLLGFLGGATLLLEENLQPVATRREQPEQEQAQEERFRRNAFGSAR